MALMIIVDIWRSQPGDYFCISTKGITGAWHDEFFARSELRGVRDYVRANGDRNVYWCPHGFHERRRKKEHAATPTLLWADIDDGKLNRIKPTVAIESSPGRYVGIWECDAPVTEALNKRLTNYIGADKGGWDLTQVLRVPGTKNHKYDPAPRVKLLWDDGPGYRVQELNKMLAPLADRPQRVVRLSEPVVVPDWRKLPGRELAHRFRVKRLAFSPFYS
jgi:hypothetical protein